MFVFEIIAFVMAWTFMCIGFYLMKKSIDSLSHKSYRNCDFTINEDQFQELLYFLRELDDKRNSN